MKKGLILALIACIVWSGAVFAAPNKVWRVQGTRITFLDSGATGGTLTLAALANGTGRYSTRFNKSTISGATATQQPFDWDIDCTFQVNVNPNVVGNAIEVYVIKSDGTRTQGNLGATDAALVTDKRKNLTFVGILALDQTTQNTSMTGIWQVEIREPSFSIGVWNESGGALNGGAVNSCGATPYSLEIQAHGPVDFDNRVSVPQLATV